MTIAILQPENEKTDIELVNPSQPQAQNSRWVVSADEAKQFIEQGATILDAREPSLQEVGCLAGAIAVTWKQFSQTQAPHRGKLLEDDKALTQKLQAVGLSNDRPVVAIGDPINGEGEDGRIVWMLRTLGHQKAVLVDGGYEALIKAGIPTVQPAPKLPPNLGDFIVKRTTVWEIQRDELKASLENENIVVIDARQPCEYAGETPYGEQRGGHIPGAINLYYKELLNDDGKLLRCEEIVTKLQQKGIMPEAEIVTYCTGGIRSGWLTSVLTTLGFTAKNYAGSMWEWSAAPAASYPSTSVQYSLLLALKGRNRKFLKMLLTDGTSR